jgi:acetyltransferase-like isoleucine patch superfamily enzyme
MAFFNVIASLIAFFIPFKLLRALRFFANMVYSRICASTFKSCGNNFHIEYPATLYGNNKVVIGNNFYSNGRLRLEAYGKHRADRFDPEIIIGDNVGINFDCHIACINKIVIGDNVLLASKIFITDHFHGKIDREALLTPPGERQLSSKGPVIIANNVWIGEGVVIMPGVTIGEHSIIGANAVVTKSFGAYSVIGGNPAVLIKSLI